VSVAPGALKLSYPIKKWAAHFVIAKALFYDLTTGAGGGTERAFFMTLILLTSVLLDRQALTMRNLTFAAVLRKPDFFPTLIKLFPYPDDYLLT
jgi:predicted membrane metal-binding protein